MAREPYHIMTNGNVLISVEIGEHPIKLNLILKDGSAWTFSYSGGSTPTATVEKAKGGFDFKRPPETFILPDGKALDRVLRSDGHGSTVEYVDPKGSGM